MLEQDLPVYKGSLDRSSLLTFRTMDTPERCCHCNVSQFPSPSTTLKLKSAKPQLPLAQNVQLFLLRSSPSTCPLESWRLTASTVQTSFHKSQNGRSIPRGLNQCRRNSVLSARLERVQPSNQVALAD